MEQGIFALEIEVEMTSWKTSREQIWCVGHVADVMVEGCSGAAPHVLVVSPMGGKELQICESKFAASLV